MGWGRGLGRGRGVWGHLGWEHGGVEPRGAALLGAEEAGLLQLVQGGSGLVQGDGSRVHELFSGAPFGVLGCHPESAIQMDGPRREVGLEQGAELLGTDTGVYGRLIG